MAYASPQTNPALQNEDTQGLFLALTEEIKQDIEILQKWRVRAQENFAFVTPWGQWTAEDRAFLIGQERPVITFDKVSKFIRALCGIEVNNRQQTTYIPREPDNAGEVKANELLTQASDWMDETCHATRHQSRAFRDMTICGVGATESALCYDEDPRGTYVESRIYPLEIGWDRHARDQNVSDAKRRWRVRRMTVKEARDLLPGVTDDSKRFTDADLDADWAYQFTDVKAGEAKSRQEKELREESTLGGEDKRNVRIVQVQWWEYESYIRTANPRWTPPAMGGAPDGAEPQHLDLSPAEFAKLKAELAPMLGGKPWPSARLRRKVFKQAFLGARVLQVGPAPRPDGFTLNIMTGEPDDVEGTFYGIVDLLRDPQMWSNKLYSQILHMVNSTAKGGILAEKGAFADVKQALESYPRADAVTVVEDGAIRNGRIMAKPGTAITAGVQTLLQMAEQAFSDVTGMNLELMGLADREQPGVLEAQRKQAAMTILATLFDALSLFRNEVGRTKLHFIQTHLADDRWIRINAKDGAKAVKLTKQATKGGYDTLVGEAPNAPNTKERAFAAIQMIMPALGERMTPEGAAMMLDYVPGLPSRLVEGLKGMLTQPQPGAEEQAALQKEAATADIDKNRASAAASKANAVLSVAKAAKEQLETQQMAQASVLSSVLAALGIRPAGSAGADDMILGPSEPALPPVPPLGGAGGGVEDILQQQNAPPAGPIPPGGLTNGGL